MDAAIIEEQLASAFDGILMNIDQTQINVEKYIKHKSRIDEEKAQNINKELSQALETKKRLQLQLETKRNEVKEYEKKLAVLRETDSEKAKQNSHIQLELAKTQRQALQTKRDSLLRTLEQRKRELETRKLEHKENKEKDEIELAALTTKTQLDIIGVGDNLIKFIFGCIDNADPRKKYHFILHLPESGSYEVTECVPELPEMPSLLARLNNDRDIYSFLKRVRKSFFELANST